MLRIRRVLETALYCDDPPAVAAFYRDVLGARTLIDTERLIALDAGEGTVLLVFRRGMSAAGIVTPTGMVPPHDGSGPVHLAFAIPTEELDPWERELARRGVAIERRITWDRGGTSLYFRDPEGHSVELATPGLWETY
jgi:catechol 2,3-dioxygenase-like lactoylglutathione lyase family enzyme